MKTQSILLGVGLISLSGLKIENFLEQETVCIQTRKNKIVVEPNPYACVFCGALTLTQVNDLGVCSFCLQELNKLKERTKNAKSSK